MLDSKGPGLVVVGGEAPDVRLEEVGEVECLGAMVAGGALAGLVGAAAELAPGDPAVVANDLDRLVRP